MNRTSQCKNCKQRFGTLTKEGLCFFCYKEKFKKWSPEFLGSPAKAMKFGRSHKPRLDTGKKISMFRAGK